MDEIASDLAACKLVFDEIGIPWVIIDGIVLGYVRKKDIIPWDTDVDIAVFGLPQAQWSTLQASFIRNKFKVKKKGDCVFGGKRARDGAPAATPRARRACALVLPSESFCVCKGGDVRLCVILKASPHHPAK